ncbi:thiol-disulfide oxidoreductase [Micromonospora sp. b486]|uniref:thiol-disulfide oxidoreductase n=1 Tax=Micromonospora sp. b486 TaxID=3053986 RepID=UPI00259C7B82|nr:thiol-disulfide oxidoreductase [Micromonospora sp. b486]MDM4784601.1 thiol-disulfide oxidoreductase [Micromonospora sp. b486]
MPGRRRWLASRARSYRWSSCRPGPPRPGGALPRAGHDATLRDLTVVADTGAVYRGDGAWFACLWALAEQRGTAERLARPHLLPLPGGWWRRPPRSASGSGNRDTVTTMTEQSAPDDRCGWAGVDGPG